MFVCIMVGDGVPCLAISWLSVRHCTLDSHPTNTTHVPLLYTDWLITQVTVNWMLSYLVPCTSGSYGVTPFMQGHRNNNEHWTSTKDVGKETLNVMKVKCVGLALMSIALLKSDPQWSSHLTNGCLVIMQNFSIFDLYGSRTLNVIHSMW